MRSPALTTFSIIALSCLPIALPGQDPLNLSGGMQHLVAEDCVAYVEVDLATLRSKGPELSIFKLLVHEETRQLLGPFGEQIPLWWNQGLDVFLKCTGLPESARDSLLSSRLVLSLSPAVGRTSGVPFDLQVILFNEAWSKTPVASNLASFFEESFGLLGEQEGVPPLGTTKLTITPDFRVHLASHAGFVVAGTSSESVAHTLRVLHGPEPTNSLARSPLFLKASKAVRAKGDVALVYLDFERFLNLCLKFMPEGARDAMGMTGFDAFGAMGYAAAFEGPGIRERFWMEVKERHGWMAGRASRSEKLESLSWVPADTVVYMCDRIDVGMAIAGVAEFLNEASPRQGRQLAQSLQKLEEGLGIASVHELFRILGPEYAVTASMSGQSIVPDLALHMAVQDPRKVEELLRRFTQPDSGLPQAKTSTYLGRELFVFHPSEQAHGFRMRPHVLPTVAMLDDHLIITPWPVSCKRLIRSLTMGEPTLSDSPDFQRVLVGLGDREAMSGTRSVTYMDTARMFGFVLDNAAPLVQSFVGTDRVRLDGWPSHDLVRQHLFGVLTVGKTDEDQRGVSGEAYSSMGVASAYVGVGMVFGSLAATWVTPMAVSPTQSVSSPALVIRPSAPDLPGRARDEIDILLRLALDYVDWEGALPAPDVWPGFITKGSKNHPNAYHPNPPLIDPWGNSYLFSRDEKGGISISSLGSDGVPGGKGEAADLSMSLQR